MDEPTFYRVKIENSFQLYFHPGLFQHIIIIIIISIIVDSLILGKINYSILFYSFVFNPYSGNVWGHLSWFVGCQLNPFRIFHDNSRSKESRIVLHNEIFILPLITFFILRTYYITSKSAGYSLSK